MKITDILIQKRRKNRVSIYIDGKYSFSLDYDNLARSNLHVGDEIEEKKIEKLVKKDEFSRARDYAYLLISYRDRSEYELRRRLLDKDYCNHTVNEVLGFFKKEGLVNDRVFVNKYLENVILNKPMGRIKVVNELRSKMISREIIDELLDEKLGIEEEKRLAKKAALKKVKALLNYPEETARRRLFTHLRNRGFQYDIINDTVKEIFSGNIQ